MNLANTEYRRVSALRILALTDRMAPVRVTPADRRPRALLASGIPTTSKEEKVTKSEFVDQVADRAGLSKKDAAEAVEAVLETIEDALKRGSDVTFSGFGKFSVSERGAREGRNPATGDKIQIPASRVPKFTAGAGLKKAIK
jgi:DNA-binding protein HU-beta